MTNRQLIPLFSDTHGGHKLGLLNPNAQIWDTSDNPPMLVNAPELNKWQMRLWDIYNWCLDEIKLLAGNDEVIPHHIGDATQGSKFLSHLVAIGMKNQGMIAMWNMMPWFEKFDTIKRFRLISGTETHEGFESLGFVQVYEYLEADVEDVEFKISHHALQDIQGVLCDMAHHGPPPSSRTWLDGNLIRYYLKDIFLRSKVQEKQIPRIVVRGHFHSADEETITERVKDRFYKMTGIILPSFSGLNSYARKVTRSTSGVVNGMCCLEIIDGKLVDIHWFLKSADTRLLEKL